MAKPKDETLISTDGATIGYRTVGHGPSIIVVPGVLSIAADFDDFASALAETFTVHTIERRGRGRSAPQGTRYSIGELSAGLRKRGLETGGVSECHFGEREYRQGRNWKEPFSLRWCWKPAPARRGRWPGPHFPITRVREFYEHSLGRGRRHGHRLGPIRDGRVE